MNNKYRYGVHQDLAPAELFFFIAVEQTCEQIGIADVEGVILIFAGWPILPTRQKFAGATKGTSVASVMSRSLFRHEIKRKVLPTLTLKSMKSFRIILTRRLSVFIGRTIPGVGWVLLAHDVFMIGTNTVVKYNRLVKFEDRIL
ncbi:STM2901 family protein [Paraburkholderia aspalathi]|uniref:STM2901 family protein n=1 Tax=Paraburkholderia aspalathi TaxID=1324617 RepID=UPI0038BCDC30